MAQASAVLFQAHAQFGARPEQPALCRRHRNSEPLGHLRHRQLVDIAQDEHVPEQWRDAADLLLQDYRELA